MSNVSYTHKQCMQFYNRSDSGNGQTPVTNENIDHHIESDLHYHWTANVKKTEAALAVLICASNNRPESGRKDYNSALSEYRTIREKVNNYFEGLQDNKAEGNKLNTNPPEKLHDSKRYLVKKRYHYDGGTSESE